MLEPKDVVIDGKTFIISKFPAVAGREIVTQYPTSAVPKLGDYQTNQDLMFKIMAFVGVYPTPGQKPLMLVSQDLINNHVPSWEMLLKVEWAMMEYNCSFFQNGRISTFLDECAQMLPKWITEMLTPLLQPSSRKKKQSSKS